MSAKPNLSYQQIWNLNFGYLGSQVCFSLVMANTSRILSGFGADTSDLAFLWLVAPLSGLIFQPLVGYFSDKLWCRYGRRIPFILLGVIIAGIMMIVMPNSHFISGYLPPVFAGISLLFLIQSALNIAMQPYRSLVGDMVNEKQKNLGFSIQTLLTNIGGVIGSFLPFVLSLWGVSNQLNGDLAIVPTVAWSFYIGAGLLLLTNLWTCFRVKEYPPRQLDIYNRSDSRLNDGESSSTDKAFKSKIFLLTVIQFFSWFAFYYLWVYTTDGIAENIWKTQDTLSESYNNAANWFGVLTGFYSVVAALFSLFMYRILKGVTREKLYVFSLILGGLSLLSIHYIQSQYLLLIPMIGVGIAWAMILTVPFAVLSSIVPHNKMGLYMGLFNFTIVLPQIVAGVLGNFLFENVAGNSIGMLTLAGISLLIGAVSASFMRDEKKQI